MSDYDAIIIGAGAGGGAAAYSLTRQGFKVLLLEAGPRFSPLNDYQLDKTDWERHRFPEKQLSRGHYSFAPLQALDPRWEHLRSWNRNNGDYVTGMQRIPSGPGYHHVQGIGGSTLHFTGEAHRFNPASMQMASRFDVAADWPLSYPELVPFYEQAEQLTGVAGVSDIPGQQYRNNILQPPHPFSDTSQVLQRGAEALGLTWQPNNRAALSRSLDVRLPCNYCNNCNRGCPRGDKGSVDITFIRKAELTGLLKIRPESPVLQIETDHNKTVTGVIYSNSGQHHRVSAQIVVLAGGAIETPRLLLNSATETYPDGLANESGAVGKNFMETLSWSCSGLSDQPLNTHKGLPADGICWNFSSPDSIPGVIGGCRFSSSTAEAELNGPAAYAQRVIPGWGSDLKQAMRDNFGQAVTIGAIGESLPNANSYISLDRATKDPQGLPVAQIHSFLAESELNRLDFMARKCREILKAAGINQLVEEYGSYDLFSATHVFGTCRMGTAPETSVVNPFGQSHRWRNLFICDASIFPSSGGGESPSLTIEALSLRTCEWIGQNRSNLV